VWKPVVCGGSAGVCAALCGGVFGSVVGVAVVKAVSIHKQRGTATAE